MGVRKEYKTRGGTYIGADGIDLEIQAGKMTALLGPSGSGELPTCNVLTNVSGPERLILFFPCSLSFLSGMLICSALLYGVAMACRQDYAFAANIRPRGTH